MALFLVLELVCWGLVELGFWVFFGGLVGEIRFGNY